MKIRTVTIDFWGTLLFDPPSSDDRYRRRRVDDFAEILEEAGFRVSIRALDAAYDASGSYLGRIWSTNRDVPVQEHVAAILDAVGSSLRRRLSSFVMAELVEAYSRPVLMVPPSVDPSARGALDALSARGYTLVVVSNTMRTPGVTLRKVLDRQGLLGYFKHLTFSDEVGIRKPATAIFELSLRAVGGEPGAAVHVGDDGVLDVAGARAAGMRVIRVGRSPGRNVADALIPDLSGLVAAVERLDGT